MKIDIDKLIASHNESHPGDKLSRVKIARGLVKAGLYGSEIAVLNMIRFNIKGRAKSLDLKIIGFVMDRLNLNTVEVFEGRHTYIITRKEVEELSK